MADEYSDCPLCKCCNDCVECASVPGTVPSIVIDIQEWSLPCYPSVCTGPFVSVAGSRTVKPCANITALGKADCSSKYKSADSGRTDFFVTNLSSKCVYVQFYFTISGIVNDECSLEGSLNCGTAHDYGGNGVDVYWFYLCLLPGQRLTPKLIHRIKGCAKPCCFNQATLSAFKYKLSCYHPTDCPTSDCSSLAGCDGCCQCCCYNDTIYTVNPPFGGIHTWPCADSDYILEIGYEPACSGRHCEFPEYMLPCCEETCPELAIAAGKDCNGPCEFPLVIYGVGCNCHCEPVPGDLSCVGPPGLDYYLLCDYKPKVTGLACMEFDSYTRCSHL